jgi:hypothetical protein
MKKFMFLLFAVVFSGVAAGVFFGLISPNYRDERISRTGTPAVGTVTRISSNLEVNGESIYRIHFIYTNLDGIVVEGNTNSAYTRWEAEQIRNRGTIDIRISNSGRAVAANFQMTRGITMFWIFAAIFGAVGLGMGGAFVYAVLGSAGRAQIRAKGTDSVGSFITSGVGIIINGVPKHNLTFSFRGADGIEYTQKTPSKYQQWQIDSLRSLGQFKIKYLGKKAIITERIQLTAAREHSHTNQHAPVAARQMQPQQSRRCEFCGAIRKNNICCYCGN